MDMQAANIHIAESRARQKDFIGACQVNPEFVGDFSGSDIFMRLSLDIRINPDSYADDFI